MRRVEHRSNGMPSGVFRPKWRDERGVARAISTYVSVCACCLNRGLIEPTPTTSFRHHHSHHSSSPSPSSPCSHPSPIHPSPDHSNFLLAVSIRLHCQSNMHRRSMEIAPVQVAPHIGHKPSTVARVGI